MIVFKPRLITNWIAYGAHKQLESKVKFTVPIITALALGFLSPQPAHAQVFSDRDWNVKMKVSCGAPDKQSIRKVKTNGDRKIRLVLKPGDIGKCKTDNVERHGAKYWERAEISQANHMKSGKTYAVEWSAVLEQGFVGKEENFFQIHAWNDPCSAYPPLMVRFHNGNLRVMALRNLGPKAGKVWLSKENGRHVKVNTKNISIKQLVGKETRFKVVAHFARNGWVTMYINDKIIANKAPMEMATCGKPYIKMGVYRPGPALKNPRQKPSQTSSIVVDDIKITALK